MAFANSWKHLQKLLFHFKQTNRFDRLNRIFILVPLELWSSLFLWMLQLCDDSIGIFTRFRQSIKSYCRLFAGRWLQIDRPGPPWSQKIRRSATYNKNEQPERCVSGRVQIRFLFGFGMILVVLILQSIIANNVSDIKFALFEFLSCISTADFVTT